MVLIPGTFRRAMVAIPVALMSSPVILVSVEIPVYAADCPAI